MIWVHRYYTVFFPDVVEAHTTFLYSVNNIPFILLILRSSHNVTYCLRVNIIIIVIKYIAINPYTNAYVIFQPTELLRPKH